MDAAGCGASGKTMANAGLAVTPVEAGRRRDVSQNCDSHADRNRQCARWRSRRLQLAVQRRAADAERLRPRPRHCRRLRASARCSAAALGLGRGLRAALDAPPSRSAAGSGFVRHSGVMPSASRAERGRADDEVVGIDRDQPAAAAIAIGRKQDARVRERQAEILRLDPARGVADRHRDQIGEAFGEVGAAGGDVERRGEPALVIVDRRRWCSSAACCA